MPIIVRPEDTLASIEARERASRYCSKGHNKEIAGCLCDLPCTCTITPRERLGAGSCPLHTAIDRRVRR